MPRLPTVLSILKQVLLLCTVLYFYLLAFALIFHINPHGLDNPTLFLFFGALFLLGLTLEAVLAFWDRLKFLFWIALGVATFAVIGLYLAPTLYGQKILVYVFLEPLVIVFIGGFAFSVGQVLATQFLPNARLTPSQLANALARLPGWKTERSGMVKTYAFDDFSQALNFVNRIGSVIGRSRHRPELLLKGTNVTVRLTTPERGGVTATDITHAKRFDTLS